MNDLRFWPLCERRLDGLAKRLEVPLDHTPDLVIVHIEVGVNEDVSHLYDRPPWNLWSQRSPGICHTCGGLTNLLHRVKYCSREHSICIEVRSTSPFCEEQRIPGDRQHMFQSFLILRARGRSLTRHTGPTPPA
jgi:hypothetical protein